MFILTQRSIGPASAARIRNVVVLGNVVV